MINFLFYIEINSYEIPKNLDTKPANQSHIDVEWRQVHQIMVPLTFIFSKYIFH